MRRINLYLDDELWNTLHARARSTGTTISELVRTAVQERYLGDLQERRKAMQAFVGIRKERHEFDDCKEYLRSLRRGARLERLGNA